MDVERIKIELPVKRPKFVNLYLVDGKCLIDGGLLETSFVNSLAERLDDVKDILITHHHVDHIGLAMLNSVKVYMHPIELKLIEYSYNIDTYTKWARSYGINVRYLKSFIWLSRGLILKSKIKFVEGGENLFGLKVIAMPGHSPGHIGFYSDKILFSGDAILSKTTTHIGLYPGYRNPLKDHLGTLKRVRQMEIDTIYPAHEKPIKNPEKRIEELIDHYRQRIAEIKSALSSKPMRVAEVAELISWRGKNFTQLNDFDKLLVLSETLAYLEYLVYEGLVRKIRLNGVWYFSLQP